MATIGIDVTALSTSASGGIGTSQYRTMRALEALGTGHRFIMYAAKPPVIPFSDSPLDIGWPLRLGEGPTTRSNVVWMQTGINRLLRADEVDLFWSPRHLLPFHARDIARVATVQDFWHLHAPGQQPLLNRMANRYLIGRILKVADQVVTTSQATADDAIVHYRVPADRITVVPLGVDEHTFHRRSDQDVAALLAPHGLDGRFVLAMDVYNPRKNAVAIFHAFAALPAEIRSQTSLVGLGSRRATANPPDLVGIAERLGIGAQLRLLEDVSSEMLTALYSAAAAFVYPSVYEGFGMPVLEAMACGCPTITSETSSLPEVAGDAALLVDPASAEAIAEAMTVVLTDVGARDQLVRAGLRRAEAFTWERTARGMVGVFEQVLGSRN
jgi:glycosyltransferase involved in cell wall biosynthesis